MQDFPVLLGVLLRFIALLGRGPYAFKSAVNIIGSLRWFSSILDSSSEKTFDAVLVSISMKGLKPQLSRPLRQKIAIFCISLDQVLLFVRSLGFQTAGLLVCHAAGFIWVLLII